MVGRRIVVAVCAAAWLLLSSESSAQQLQEWVGGYQGPYSATSPSPTLPSMRAFLGAKKFFNSFTSYQFPNPFSPANDPLSRLEFPIDQWFLGGKTVYDAPAWSLEAQAWFNVTREAKLKMQDSDWDVENMPQQKTIFSESHCRLNKGFLCDTALGVLIPLELLARIGRVKGVLGYRYDFFYFTAHDGEQMVFMDDYISSLNGDGIDFKQSFQTGYVGFNVRTTLDLSRFSRQLPSVSLEAQVDYGVLRGKNEDFHLLREGDRVTTERTSGHSWRFSTVLELAAPGEITAVVEADFRRVLTHGSHQLTNSVFDLDFSFDGSRVWSDQMSLTLAAQRAF